MKLGILGRYAPSAQFTTIALALLLSGGLVYAADSFTSTPKSTVAIETDQASQPQDDASNWQAALYASQAANASTSITAPNPNVVSQFLQAAQSSNVTDTVARTIFVNLSTAKAQGLGDDTPTQDQIVATAAAQVASAQASATSYSYNDLTIISASNGTLHAYGNEVMQVLAAYPDASEQATLLSIDEAVEGGSTTQGAKLAEIGAAYKSAAAALVAVPVPQTIAPLELEAINNLLSTAASFKDMEAITSDPVRGLGGLQAYENLMDENATVFTNIAQELNKDGILFTKDEPGNAWSILLSAPALSGSQ
jgi:hypothetical protein